MSYLRALLVLCVVLATAACAARSVVEGPPPGDAQPAPADAADAPTFDAPTFDAPSFDVPPSDRGAGDAADAAVETGVGDECTTDRECPAGRRCLQGYCAEDVCLAAEGPCGADRCTMRCVPVRDVCEGVRCAATETCFAGRCVAGCFPAPCAGVRCPEGQFCDDGTGACTRVRECPGRCAAGFACHVQCVPRTPCDAVQCAEGELCVDGRCARNPCARESCAPGAICVDGACTPTCGCDPPCDRSPRDRCVMRRCVCPSLCRPDTLCGTDDGCGGRCLGPCANPFATCDPVLYTCTCASRCSPASACGDDDGCGGRCSGNCAVGERCDTALRRCICVSRCPEPADFVNTPCGAPVANLCPGGPQCGSGGGCGPGERCDTAAARCVCVDEDVCAGGPGDGGAMDEDAPPSDSGGGGGGGDGGAPDAAECPEGRTRCGSRCADLAIDGTHCGACGTPCPFGTECRGGVCACPAPLTLCGDACVNTQSRNDHCGGCGNTCPPRTNCEGGLCACIPSCVVDPNAVACGVEIPNACPGAASCGVGRACAEGEVCDTRARRCVCVPRCPAGVRCGAADGCGGQCVGLCEAGTTCSQDPDDARRYFCSAEGCASGCRCGEVCVMNRCAPITCVGGGAPCPCACCGPGQVCTAARCVMIPP